MPACGDDNVISDHATSPSHIHPPRKVVVISEFVLGITPFTPFGAHLLWHGWVVGEEVQLT